MRNRPTLSMETLTSPLIRRNRTNLVNTMDSTTAVVPTIVEVTVIIEGDIAAVAAITIPRGTVEDMVATSVLFPNLSSS